MMTTTVTVESLEGRIDDLEADLAEADRQAETLERDLEDALAERDELLERLEKTDDELDERLRGAREVAERADHILRDLAHRATIGEPQAIAAETELREFLEAVAELMA